jgi:hypothetical protein
VWVPGPVVRRPPPSCDTSKKSTRQIFELQTVTWRSSFESALSNWSHPTPTESSVNISAPTLEKTPFATMKIVRNRESRSESSSLITNLPKLLHEFLPLFSKLLHDSDHVLMTKNLSMQTYLPTNQPLPWHPKSPSSNHPLNLMGIHNMLSEHP